MNYIHRNISKSIASATPYFPVITITGPRQSGKTTLCKQLFPGFAYINLEDMSIREQVTNDIKGFLNEYPQGLVIDEAHYIPDLFSYIQVKVDEDRSRKFVLTGSSNFSLLQSITQSLAGRTALFTLLPFSLNEIRDIVSQRKTDTIILDGFYPAIHANQVPRELLYKNYYTTYVERDVRQLISIKNMKLFQAFIRLCAGRIGSEFNASSMSGEVGVSVPTITEWVTILSASYIVHLLPPYYENIGKRLIKTPKIYFHDTGLACYLLGIENEAHMATHPLRGPLFENMIVNEFMKNRLNIGKDPNLYFYRDKSQNEVDLVHIQGLNIGAYEIKSAKTFHNDFNKGLNYIKKLFGERVSRAAVIYDGNMETHSELNGVFNFRNFHLD